jgi:hypothetical protein
MSHQDRFADTILIRCKNFDFALNITLIAYVQAFGVTIR